MCLHGFFQFLNVFGDVQSIKKAEDRHAKLFLPHRSTSELKKRHAEDFLASDKAKMAKSYSVPSPAQSLMGAYPSAQNQWTAAYGVQPQTWPPATQGQGQQWAPGYTQQVDCHFLIILCLSWVGRGNSFTNLLWTLQGFLFHVLFWFLIDGFSWLQSLLSNVLNG